MDKDKDKDKDKDMDKDKDKDTLRKEAFLVDLIQMPLATPSPTSRLHNLQYLIIIQVSSVHLYYYYQYKSYSKINKGRMHV